MSDDNRMIIPFSTMVMCWRCNRILKHGDVAYSGDNGYLYCAKHNPKKRAGPSETKEAGGRGKRDERQ